MSYNLDFSHSSWYVYEIVKLNKLYDKPDSLLIILNNILQPKTYCVCCSTQMTC